MGRNLFLVLAVAGFLLPSLAAAQTESGLAGISSEKYNPKAMTAVASDLRLGMRLTVTNLANGRTVTVKVSDSRSLAPGRILDLSPAAAKALAIEEGQVTKVEIHALRVEEPDVTRIPAPEPTPEPVPITPAAGREASLPAPPETYFQMGAFRTESHAQDLVRSLQRQGDHPQIFQADRLFRVFLIVKESEASALTEKLTKEGRIGFFQVSKPPAGTSVKLTTE